MHSSGITDSCSFFPRARYGGEDCNLSELPLEFGEEVIHAPSLFEYQYYQLPLITGMVFTDAGSEAPPTRCDKRNLSPQPPPIAAAAMTQGLAELEVAASYFGPELGQWARVHPVILLSPVRA